MKTVVIKATNACNLACRYCYADSKPTNNSLMSKVVLERMISSLSSHYSEDNIHYIWHGGEPLLQDLPFFKKAIHFQRKFAKTAVSNSIQTNGSLVKPSIIEFCKKYNFNLGFSLDGYQDLHDKTRPFVNGSSSFNECFEGLLLAKEAGLGNGAVTVVSRDNIHHIKEIINFFQEHNLYLKLNPLILSGRAIQSNNLAISPEEYGQKMIEAFDYWYDTSKITIKIDPFTRIIGNLVSGTPMGCNYSTNCQNSFLSINVSGDVYPCGRFDGEENFKMGNITTDSMSSILNSEARLTLLSRDATNIVGCSECEYMAICNGGCINNAYNLNRDINARDVYCSAYRMMFTHIKNKITDDINVAK